MPLSLGSWLAPLGGSLQHIAVICLAELKVVSPLDALMHLQYMELSAFPLVFEAGARLPQALTRLELGQIEHKSMPRQVRCGERRSTQC